MSFPAYPEYKNTEIPWMQRIPSSWQLLPFFSRFFERKESNKGMKSENLLSLSYGRIVRKDITTLEGLLPASFETYQVVHPGDIVFRLTDLQNDKRSLRSAIVNEKGIITSAYLAVSAKDFNPSFSNYLFRAYDLMKVFYSMGGGLRQSMKYDDMKWLQIVCPSINEQTQIARFLDHETAKIDALIREQERLIELLQEKRQAVISHAVTKGLDPDVPMKDSGVEWLGEVPEHWDVGPVKYFFEFLDGKRIPLSAEDRGKRQGNYPYYGASGIIDHIDDYIFDEDLVLVSEDGANLLARSSPIAFVARGMYWVNNHAHILRPPDRNLTYWAEVIEANELDLLVTGSAQPKLTSEALGSLIIAVPPTEKERADIEKHLLNETSGLRTLTNEAAKAVQILRERRSTLISAAVTGKIDVRNWQPPVDESAFDEEVRQAGMEATV